MKQAKGQCLRHSDRLVQGDTNKPPNPVRRLDSEVHIRFPARSLALIHTIFMGGPDHGDIVLRLDTRVDRVG